MTLQFHDIEGELLQEYRAAILSLLRWAGYHNCAEDVASDMVADLCKRMRAGDPFRPRGTNLPDCLRREAVRKAKTASSFKTIGASEFEDVTFRKAMKATIHNTACASELEEDRSPSAAGDKSCLNRELMSALRGTFRSSEIADMIEAAAAGSVRLRDLASAAGLSVRTFRTRLRDMRVPPR